MDHSGGLRAYVAEGATIVVAAPTKAYFEKALKNARTVAPDELQKKPKAANIVEVKDQMTLKDDVGEIRLYNIPNPHAEGYILSHVVKDNIVYVTDLISPRGQVARTEGTAAVGEALRKYGVSGATIAGGHGTTAKQADMAPALAQN
jgi:glyoxylase-like metal-dependent hydrolase (beta-lactamase superfamily II)